VAYEGQKAVFNAYATADSENGTVALQAFSSSCLLTWICWINILDSPLTNAAAYARYWLSIPKPSALQMQLNSSYDEAKFGKIPVLKS
jgi:hypothetical protein